MTELYVYCGAIALLAAGAALGVRRFRRRRSDRAAEAPAPTLQQFEALNRRAALLEAELETSRREHSALLSRCRHDLAGCLNVVSGFRELLELEADSLTPPQRNYVTQMGDGMRRAFEVMNQLKPERQQGAPTTNGMEVRCK
ncbi:MAG: HAMP domain-containing histidine kinase [Acidobacteria bacterium]|nr:HAMP domain-containing histidine kinase [Acidobacteriota bacterium]